MTAMDYGKGAGFYLNSAIGKVRRLYLPPRSELSLYNVLAALTALIIPGISVIVATKGHEFLSRNASKDFKMTAYVLLIVATIFIFCGVVEFTKRVSDNQQTRIITFLFLDIVVCIGIYHIAPIVISLFL